MTDTTSSPAVSRTEEDRDFAAITEKEIFEEARDRLEIANEAETDNRKRAKAAMLFREGDQWDAPTGITTGSEDQPELTVNLTDAFVRRVVNNIKQQRPRGKCHPVGEGADIEIADVLNGIGRHIETRSEASVAYDMAAERSVDAGVGYFRVLPEYVDERSFSTDLRIMPIRNIFSVFMDPASIMPSGADQNWCLITVKMKRQEYKRKYPNAKNVNWSDVSQAERRNDWEDKEEVRLAEYFRIREKAEKLYLIRGKNGEEFTRFRSELPRGDDGKVHLEDLATRLAGMGFEIVTERDSVRRSVEWFKLNGLVVIERHILPGQYIPVFRVEGNAIDIDGRIRRRGMVEGMQDPQRMVNYGEPLALDTPIPTPTGWSQMGDLRPGDQVFNERGEPCRVDACTPVLVHRQCMRVIFDDGESIVADADHPWTVLERGKRSMVAYEWTTRTVPTRALNPEIHRIEMQSPLDLPGTELPIDPYLLGVWLGDGCRSTPQITQGDQDIAQMRAQLETLGFKLSPNRRSDTAGAQMFTVYGVRKQFGKLGLLNNKHIPGLYLRSSQEQRQALLQGLMDTDGSVSRSNLQCEFSSSFPALAKDFYELLASLGIKCGIYRVAAARKVINGHDCQTAEAWRFSFMPPREFPVFRLARKLALTAGRGAGYSWRTKRRWIKSIMPVESVPVRCIEVDTPSHLFLAGRSMVPTHNCAKIKRLGLAPKAPWVAAEGQLDGHPEWDDANLKPYNVLTYKPVILETSGGPVMMPPPMRQPPAQIEAGFSEFVQGMRSNLLAVAGMPNEPGQDQQGVVVSGKAISKRQYLSDQAHFQYYDNLTLAIAQCWRVMVEWIPHYFSEQRMQRIIGEDSTPQMVKINEVVNEDGVTRVKNDLSVGKYDVVMDTGPGYETKREEGAENLIDMLRIPVLAEIVAKTSPDLVFRSIDHPYMQELADRLMAQNPEGLKKIMDGLSTRAKHIVQSLASENAALKQQLQQLQMDLKVGLSKEQMISATKVHDTQVRSHTALAVEEIRAGGKLIDSGAARGHEAAMFEKQVLADAAKETATPTSQTGE